MHDSCRKLIVFWSGLCAVLLGLMSSWIHFGDGLDLSQLAFNVALLVAIGLLWLFPTAFVGLVAISTKGRR